jgi:outer membrane protein assembly factor BamE (lipoprotein component of BamABCDE complex)
MVKAVRMVGRFGGLTAAIAVLALASGCTSLRSHQGYIIDADLVNSVQPGVDNRTSVMQTLGKPSFASQFNQGEWYYIARDTRNFAYNNPKVTTQTTLKVSFDAKGNVTAVTRTGAEQIAKINPSGEKTPTLGRRRSIFDELFGNIGSVGAVAPQGGDNGS